MNIGTRRQPYKVAEPIEAPRIEPRKTPAREPASVPERVPVEAGRIAR